MKKLFISFAFVCLFAVQGMAQNLYIEKADGTSEGVAIENIQKITFAEGNMVLALTDSNTNSYVIAEIGKLSFVAPTGIINKEIKKESFVSYSSNRDEISINCEKGATIQVYGANGQLVKSVKVEEGSLNLGDLSKGVYVIKSKNQSAKIIKL